MDNIDNAEGLYLDMLVLQAMGLEVLTDGSAGIGNFKEDAFAMVGDPSVSPFLRSPSREWSVGGPLIQINRIALRFENLGWQANCAGATAQGPSPLVAAMRALCKAADDLPLTGPAGKRVRMMSEAIADLGNVLARLPSADHK